MIQYTLTQQVKGVKDLNDKTAPSVYQMVECYKNRDAFVAHVKSPHFQKRGFCFETSWE
jgi:quinol monooxygenase YgiN